MTVPRALYAFVALLAVVFAVSFAAGRAATGDSLASEAGSPATPRPVTLPPSPRIAALSAASAPPQLGRRRTSAQAPAQSAAATTPPPVAPPQVTAPPPPPPPPAAASEPEPALPPEPLTK